MVERHVILHESDTERRLFAPWAVENIRDDTIRACAARTYRDYRNPNSLARCRARFVNRVACATQLDCEDLRKLARILVDLPRHCILPVTDIMIDDEFEATFRLDGVPMIMRMHQGMFQDEVRVIDDGDGRAHGETVAVTALHGPDEDTEGRELAGMLNNH